MEPSIFAISQYLARSRQSPSSRLRLTSQGPDEGPYFRVNWTLPTSGNSDQYRTRTRDPDNAPQTTHPRAYFLTRESRPRETALGEERAAGARSGSGRVVAVSVSRASTSHAAQFPADPKSRNCRPHPSRKTRGGEASLRVPKQCDTSQNPHLPQRCPVSAGISFLPSTPAPSPNPKTCNLSGRTSPQGLTKTVLSVPTHEIRPTANPSDDRN